MNIAILTPEKEVFSGDIKSVIVPGTTGKFEILEHHAAIVSSLTKGDVRIVKADNSKLNFSISGGFVEMLNNEVSLLVSGFSEKNKD